MSILPILTLLTCDIVDAVNTIDLVKFIDTFNTVGIIDTVEFVDTADIRNNPVNSEVILPESVNFRQSLQRTSKSPKRS